MGALYSILRNFLCGCMDNEKNAKIDMDCESNCFNCGVSNQKKIANRQLRRRTKSIYEYDSYKDLTDIDLSNS